MQCVAAPAVTLPPHLLLIGKIVIDRDVDDNLVTGDENPKMLLQ